ncbi:MAG: Maf family protein [Lachnospiraceae bacterium]|nr:Maf family protein [Lachnospiraceae bacterium]
MKKIILASGSPRRKELLEQIGLQPVVIKSTVEEIITKTAPDEMVMELSSQKCLDVAQSIKEEAVILGADTIVVKDGEILGKPDSEDDAISMLRSLQGRSHQVYTGVTLAWINDGEVSRTKTFAVCTEVTVSPMTEEEIRAYVATGDPMDKAGAYGIQGIFAKHVEKIHGDYNNVVGLPVAAVYEALK